MGIEFIVEILEFLGVLFLFVIKKRKKFKGIEIFELEDKIVK